jgi:hypothetical protein
VIIRANRSAYPSETTLSSLTAREYFSAYLYDALMILFGVRHPTMTIGGENARRPRKAWLMGTTVTGGSEERFPQAHVEEGVAEMDPYACLLFRALLISCQSGR